MNQEQLKFKTLEKLKQVEHDVYMYVEYSKEFTREDEADVLKKIIEIQIKIKKIS